MKIAHCFVHTAIESEYLKQFGEVTGYGLDITVTYNLDKAFEVDLMENSLNDSYDFGLFHPKCQKWSRGTKEKGKEPDQIPQARKLAKQNCDYWIIENVPTAPLQNPVILNGGMFNKELKYERAFESNFEIEQPKMPTKIKYRENTSEIRKAKAGRIKDYTAAYYDVRSLQANCIPRIYLKYLLSHCPKFEIEKPEVNND